MMRESAAASRERVARARPTEDRECPSRTPASAWRARVRHQHDASLTAATRSALAEEAEIERPECHW